MSAVILKSQAIIYYDSANLLKMSMSLVAIKNDKEQKMMKTRLRLFSNIFAVFII